LSALRGSLGDGKLKDKNILCSSPVLRLEVEQGILLLYDLPETVCWLPGKIL
jgi:hypothetical protein